MPYDYLRDPDAIYRRSFELIREEADLSRLPRDLHSIALRLIHAVADPTILPDLAWSDGAVAAGQTALGRGAPVLVDAQMVAHGIIRARLPAGNTVTCLLDDPAVLALSRRRKTTRSAAPPELSGPLLHRAILPI